MIDVIGYSLVACFEVNLLILVAVVTCTGVNIYAAQLIWRRATRSLACVRVNVRAIYRCIVMTVSRHGFLYRKAPTKVTKTRAEGIQGHTALLGYLGGSWAWSCSAAELEA